MTSIGICDIGSVFTWHRIDTKICSIAKPLVCVYVYVCVCVCVCV